MANFNKVLLMGNLTRDPQLTYLPSQTPVVDFGLAINRKWTGQDGSAREETCFVDCRAFGRPAETINKYLKKGQPLFVEGRLTFDQWTAQDGSKKSKHRVTVENFQFLGGGGGGSQRGAGGGDVSDDMGSQVPPIPHDDIPF
ncbi:MAG TPA: single-stranded DNA-binding protein [Phycisphaerales bacterium]|nr:single-stranded DNA-binding protein [Phycisphaerales bacterium]